MARSINEEINNLRQTLSEKNCLVDKQTGIINRQLEALSELNRVMAELEEYREKLGNAEEQMDSLKKENQQLVDFRNRVQKNVFYRILRKLNKNAFRK